MQEQEAVQQQLKHILSTNRHRNSKNKLYVQMNFDHHNISSINPQHIQSFQKSQQQLNSKQFVQEMNTYNNKLISYKMLMKKRVFHNYDKDYCVIHKHPKKLDQIDLIKSYSQKQHRQFSFSKSNNSHVLSQSLTLKQKNKQQKIGLQKKLSSFLDASYKFTHKNKHLFKGQTLIQKQKNNNKIMNIQRHQILQLIQKKTPLRRYKNIQQVTNKQKYSIPFIQYTRKKTKSNIDSYYFDKHIKLPQNNMQKFQQFIISEGKFKKQTQTKLHNFYLGIRHEFHRIRKLKQHLN